MQQQPSGRKTRRTDPVITTITTTTTPASMAPSVTTTGVTATTAARDGASALRTITEGELSGGEESGSDLTQPQFVTQPDLTQPSVVVQSTRGNTFLYLTTWSLFLSKYIHKEVAGNSIVCIDLTCSSLSFLLLCNSYFR